MEGPPPQIVAKSIDDYLEQLSKGVFQAGISWRVVDSKWPSIRTAFHAFKVERVARMTDRDIDALVKDERVIRSRPKIGDRPQRERAAGARARGRLQEASQVVTRVRGARVRPQEALQVCRGQRRLPLPLDGEAPRS